MDHTADAVIVGGGIMGASVAHFLAKGGFGKVVLLDNKTLAGASTGHSAANVRTLYSNPLTIRLAVRAVEMFENQHEELGGDCGFDQVGFLCLLEEHTAPGRTPGARDGAEIRRDSRGGITGRHRGAGPSSRSRAGDRRRLRAPLWLRRPSKDDPQPGDTGERVGTEGP